MKICILVFGKAYKRMFHQKMSRHFYHPQQTFKMKYTTFSQMQFLQNYEKIQNQFNEYSIQCTRICEAHQQSLIKRKTK